jgi:hypothetical protein
MRLVELFSQFLDLLFALLETLVFALSIGSLSCTVLSPSFLLLWSQLDGVCNEDMRESCLSSLGFFRSALP